MLSVQCVACREAERPLPLAPVLVGVRSPLGQLCLWSGPGVVPWAPRRPRVTRDTCAQVLSYSLSRTPGSLGKEASLWSPPSSHPWNLCHCPPPVGLGDGERRQIPGAREASTRSL